MDIDFSVTAETVDQEVQESAPTQYLREPAVGPVQVENIEMDIISDQFDVLKFVYRFVDGEHEGEVFEQVEWAPKESDLQSSEDQPSNLELQLRRISRILSRVCGPKVADQATVFRGNTIEEAWEGLRELVVGAWENEGDPEKVLQLKVYGNVYTSGGQEKANLTVGRYPNFVADPAQDSELRFSSWEQDRNEEYFEFNSDEPTDMDEVEEEEYDIFG